MSTREDVLLETLQREAEREKREADWRVWTIVLTTADGCRRELGRQGRPPEEWWTSLRADVGYRWPEPEPFERLPMLSRRYRIEHMNHELAIAYYSEVL